jgi:hypothetical protein
MTSTNMEQQTADVKEAAQRCGISAALAYREIRATGKLAGVPIIRVGRRMVVPLAGLRRVLGQDDGCYA